MSQSGGSHDILSCPIASRGTVRMAGSPIEGLAEVVPRVLIGSINRRSSDYQGEERSMAVSPYGSWSSPITSEVVQTDAIRLDQVLLDGANLYWTESEPQKQGRYFVYRLRRDGTIEPVTPDDTDAF